MKINEYPVAFHDLDGEHTNPKVWIDTDEGEIHVYGQVEIGFGNPFHAQLNDLMEMLGDVAGEYVDVPSALFGVLVFGIKRYAEMIGDTTDAVLQPIMENLDPNYPAIKNTPTVPCVNCGADIFRPRGEGWWISADNGGDLCYTGHHHAPDRGVRVCRFCDRPLTQGMTGAWIAHESAPHDIVCVARGRVADTFTLPHAPKVVTTNCKWCDAEITHNSDSEEWEDVVDGGNSCSTGPAPGELWISRSGPHEPV